MINAISIDLEEWFCVYNFKDIIKRSEWNSMESRIVFNTVKLLDLFDKFETKATFFVLGWVAEEYPELITEIDNRGHEIATHGYSHSLITDLTKDEFEEDIKKAIKVTNKCIKQKIKGFRAPSFSVTNKTLWALDILRKLGIEYDSSVFPIGFHPDYGIKEAPLGISTITDGLIEVPLSVVEIFGRRIPCSGGGYFRLLPYFLTKFLMKKCNTLGRPVIFYLHPWEIDPGQPRINLPLLKKIRHYNNLNKTYSRLEKLLKDFKFAPIKEIINDISKH